MNFRRLARAAIALGLLIAAAADAAETDSWLADDKGCKFFNPNSKPGEAITWTGPCKDGFGEGQGVLQWVVNGQPGPREEGNFVHGQLEGHGSYVSARGLHYDGEFVHGEISGAGTLQWPNGDVYQGEWRNGRRNGNGRLVRANGDHYEGGWVDDKRQGKGTRDYWGGTHYEGEWEYDVPSGMGAMTWPGGWHYEGRFAGGRPVSPEEIKAADGSKVPTDRATPLKEETTGSYIPKVAVGNLGVPPKLPYGELNPYERLLVKEKFPQLQEDDEPPYPKYGARGFLDSLHTLQGRLLLEGTLVMAVVVGRDGKPLRIDNNTQADQSVLDKVEDILMRIEFKPAICHGEPCEMRYPVRMTFTLRK